jgi:hypothetical protein
MAAVDYHNTGDDTSASLSAGAPARGQTFTASKNYTLSSIKLKLWRLGNPGTVTVAVKATSSGLPTGDDLSSGTLDGSTFSAISGQWYEFTMTETSLSNATQYAITVTSQNKSGTDTLYVDIESVGEYSGGTYIYNDGSWHTDTADLMFETYEVVTTDIKSVNGLAIASVKSVNGLAIASVKSINGLE